MLKLFNMIDIGERAGSGIPNIYRVWQDQGWAEPTIMQTFDPDRTTLSLVFKKTSDKKRAINESDKRIGVRQKNAIVDYLTDHTSAKANEIAGILHVSPPRARAILTKLILDDIVVAEGGNRNRTYRLKS